MRGRNVSSYHSRPRRASPIRRVRYPGHQRDAEEHQHRDRRCPDAETSQLLAGRRARATPAGSRGRTMPERERKDLEDRVDRDQHGGGLAVTAGEVVPDQHHRDAAGQPDDDQAGAVLGQVGQEDPGQREHQRRPDDPVQHAASDDQHAPVAGDPVELAVAHLRQHRVHHQQQAERDRQRDARRPTTASSALFDARGQRCRAAAR